MNYLLPTLQLIVAGGLINVWVLRFHKGTKYRGKSAKNMREEFDAYGLPESFMWLVCLLKLGCAAALVIGIWFSAIILPAALVLAALMIGAITMHMKAGNPILKFLPAATMLLLATVIAFLGSK